MTDLSTRLRELAEAIQSCEWELPIDAQETCIEAAEQLEDATRSARFYARHYDGPAEALLGEADREAFQWAELNKDDANAS